MMKLQKHHKLVLALAAVFVLAWAIWTFIALPMSETPSLPEPGAATVPQ